MQTSSVIMLRYIEHSAESMSSRHIKDYFRTALQLHNAKTECFLALSKGTNTNERFTFIGYDLAKEAENTVDRFGMHKEEITENLPYINRIVYGELTEPEGEFDYVIIFGSGQCEYRVELAFEKFGGYSNTRFIVSGGNIHNQSRIKEAVFMKNLLLERGIESNNIYLEDESANTKENLVNSAKLISEISVCKSRKLRICIVTAGFHIMRTKIISESLSFYQKNEISFLSAYGPNTAPDKWLLTPFGRKIIYDEIKKVSWAPLEEQQKEWRLQ